MPCRIPWTGRRASLIGTWILAGVLPTMIYYGLVVLSPSVFYATACVICAFVSVATGNSWTIAGTIGIALVGIATAQGLNLGLAADALISRAYFATRRPPSPTSRTSRGPPG